MKRLIPLMFVFGFLVTVSCQKGDDSDDIFISYFKYNNTEYTTDNALLEILQINNINEYILSFYSSGIVFNYADTTYYGSGELLYFNLESTIFNSEINEYSIYDLKENETINIKSGLLYIDNESSRETIELSGGKLVLNSMDDVYYFEYESNINSGNAVSGKYKGALLVVDYKYITTALIDL